MWRSPFRWVYYGPSHATFSHQKSHLCTKRCSLGTDKLIISSFFICLIWIGVEVSDSSDSIWSFIFPQQRNIQQKSGNYFCSTIVFSKSVKLTNIFLIGSKEIKNIMTCFIRCISICNINKLFMSADNQLLNVSHLLSDIYVPWDEVKINIYSVCIWEWATRRLLWLVSSKGEATRHTNWRHRRKL